MLKTSSRNERVCSALTPEHSSPHCVAEWGVGGFNGQANGFENLNCHRGPQSLFPVSVASSPSAFGETWQGNGIWG